jgi:signal transduction histidine kinase
MGSSATGRAARRCIVEVSDTGIGIPEEALPRIFNEFYRAKNAKAMEMEGTGLGLAIAKDVVEQHGGQISVKRRRRRGQHLLRDPAERLNGVRPLAHLFEVGRKGKCGNKRSK